MIKSLKNYKRLRDALLHDDVSHFEHNLERVVDFCRNDGLIQEVLSPIFKDSSVNSTEWWDQTFAYNKRSTESIKFPENNDDEFTLRFQIMEDVMDDNRKLLSLGMQIGKMNGNEMRSTFLSIIARPFFLELSDRLEKTVNMASPESRALQAVPYDRIPNENETKIFLSHKSEDKGLVRRYHQTLKELGFSPWFDEQDMPAGSNLERSILKGFEQSCAAVFFITENFVDENYLATEVDYATRQKRSKGKKFAIITLVLSENADVPPLLETYVYKDVENELDGLYELIRALPIELGPTRWKKNVVEE